MKNKKGFTLIEIVVSVAILSVVSLFILTSVTSIVGIYVRGMNMRKATHDLTNYMTKGTTEPRPDIVPSNIQDVEFSIDDGVNKKFKGTVDIRIETKNEASLKSFTKKS